VFGGKSGRLGEPLTDFGYPTGPQNISVRDIGEPRGSGLRHPIVVDDDQSSHSGHGKAACGAGGTRVKSCEAPIAARVHTNPRMRLIPFA
jgi:hypothetical protein